jgi:hypothetical protein
MLYFTFSKGTLKEMISSERDFYSVSKPIFSYYCLKKKKESKRQRERGGWTDVGEGGGFSSPSSSRQS